MKPGDFIKINTTQGLKSWCVTGVHLGGMNQQGIITMIPFVKTDGDAYGKVVIELNVPIEFVQTVDSLQSQLAASKASRKELAEALTAIVLSWKRHGGRIIESRGGLIDNRVSEVNGAIEDGDKALTKSEGQ